MGRESRSVAEFPDKDLHRSPLHEAHLALGGRMVPFAGWEMPVQYEGERGGILREHRAVRESCGAFDISHMGQLWVRGPGAEAWLNQQLTNDLGMLGEGEGQYSFLLNEAGGVIDDLIVYRRGAEEFFLVVNASRRADDVAWLTGRLEGEVELVDQSDDFAGLAIQGPNAPEVWERFVDGQQELPPRNGIAVVGEDGIVCRTGYTGEDGFEFFCPAAIAEEVFASFLEAGAAPCGLGCRDTLRLEVCYPLNGSDLGPDRTPLEAGLGFFVKLDKGPFTGSEVLRAQKDEGLPSRLAAIQIVGKAPPARPGYPVLHEGEEVSALTSGALSPSLGRGIGLTYLPPELAKIGTKLEIQIRTRNFPAEVVKKPFYKKESNS